MKVMRLRDGGYVGYKCVFIMVTEIKGYKMNNSE